MPSSGTVDIPHVSVHDHKIQIPVDHKELNTIKKFVGLVAVNNPEPDAHTIAEAYISYYEKFDNQLMYLDSAKKYLDKKGSFSPVHYFNNQVRLEFLKNNWAGIIQLASSKSELFSNDAWTLYRIAEAYNNNSDMSKAEKYFKLAVERAPFNLEFRNKLAGMYVQNNKINEAMAEYLFILKENHKFVPALSNMSFIYLQQGKIDDAWKYINKALALDPDYEQALFNKAALYMSANNTQETKNTLRIILKKNPKNIKAQQALNSLNQ